ERRGCARDREEAQHEDTEDGGAVRAEALERHEPLAARDATLILRGSGDRDGGRRHQEIRIRGSSQPYMTSAKRFARTMRLLDTARIPWSTGSSERVAASQKSRPLPSQPKISSLTTDPTN